MLVASDKDAEDIKRFVRYQVRHMIALRENLSSVMVLFEAFDESDDLKGSEAWFEIPRDDQIALWRAPSKGGIFATRMLEWIRGLKP